jgi:hypothetical protein
MADSAIERGRLGAMEARGHVCNLSYLGTYLGVVPQSSRLNAASTNSHRLTHDETLIEWHRRSHRANHRSPVLSLQHTGYQMSLLSERSESRGNAATRGAAMCSRRALHSSALNENTSQIEKQKERALALWDAVKTNLSVDKDTADEVSMKLESGRVPPIFHAYCAMQSKRESSSGASPWATNLGASAESARDLESEHDTYPSALPARPGIVLWRHRFFPLIFPILKKSFDDIPAFFDKSGDARFWVADDGMLKEWKFNTVATEYICKLVNTDAEMIGEDMEVTSVESHLGIGKAFAGNADYLITRRASRGVVAEARRLLPEATKAIVGSPGIGKSWALLYALQQELLHNGACVLLLTPKTEIAQVYIRRQNHIYVWSTSLNGTSNLFQDRNCLVLLDPMEAVKGGTKIANGKRRVIYAASNNATHFDPDMTKRDPEAMLHLSPPSTEEVCVALPYMLSDREQFDRATVLDRLNVIGPLPRWLLSEKLFESQKTKIDSAVESMNQEDLVKLLKSDGLATGKVTLAGTVYAVSAERMTGVGGDFAEIGYNGSGLMYPVRKLSYLSKYISHKIAVARREIVLSYVGTVDVGERSTMGLAVESIF